MAEGTIQYAGKLLTITAETGYTEGQVIQVADGRAGVVLTDISSGNRGQIQVADVARLAKSSSPKILKGGRVYWDHSANQATYKPVDDRDFYCGVAVGDSEAGEAFIDVALNIEPVYVVDIARDGFRHAPVGTLALATMGMYRRGGAHNFLLSNANEAQKLDALSVPAFAVGANAIIDIVFAVVANGTATGAVDVSLGIANGTHATDADSITEHLFIHINSNDTKIYAQSKDGTTTVAATDTTVTLTAGSATANLIYVSIDLRDPADAQIYINGTLILPSTVFNVNAATGPWKLLAHVEKTSSTDTYELDLHSLRARIAEQ